MKLIDKSALVAEIERLKTIYKDDENIHHVAKYNILVDILSFLDTLEVKEVDLDKEIEEHALCMPMSEFTNDGEVEDYLDWAREEFRYFYELGLKAQKGE